ncbi:DivIVA domain-containing protein [candidate division KSB1 bacterium]|nr:DivIVA domain-containing protein [candidate division KSB1 bacterium]
MKLTPLDIRKHDFKKSMRGYDPEEVDAFMSMVSDELELLIREKNQLNDETIKLRTQLKDYQDVEQSLRETLVKAQNTVEESRANSRREAEIIIHEAELQAEHILKEAKEQLRELGHEIEMLEMQKESFAKRLHHLLQSQIELLEVLEEGDFKRKHKSTASQARDVEEEEFNRRQKREPRIVRGNDSARAEEQDEPEERGDDYEEDEDKLSDRFDV